MVTFTAKIIKNKRNGQHSINIPLSVFTNGLLEYIEDKEYLIDIKADEPDAWIFIDDRKVPLKRKGKNTFVIDKSDIEKK